MNQYLVILFVSLWSFKAFGQITDAQKYLESKYDHEIVWKNSTNVGGALLSDDWNGVKHTLKQRRYEQYVILVFNKIIGEAHELKILDILVANRNKGEQLIYQVCELNDSMNQEIVALVIEEGKEYFDNVIIAWRANTKTEQFEKIPIRKVKCMNMGFGL